MALSRVGPRRRRDRGGWLRGVVARTAARIRGSGLGQGFCRGLGQGLGRAINNAAFFALGAVICLLALYPDCRLTLIGVGCWTGTTALGIRAPNSIGRQQ